MGFRRLLIIMWEWELEGAWLIRFMGGLVGRVSVLLLFGS